MGLYDTECYETQNVIVTFKKITSYKLTYNNSKIMQGNITSPGNNSTFTGEKPLVLTLGKRQRASGW